MNVKEVLGAFLLVNNPIVLSEEETPSVDKLLNDEEDNTNNDKDKQDDNKDDKKNKGNEEKE